jgi:succinyl-CoA synthetase beta subunit
LTEARAKAALAAHGLVVPASVRVRSAAEARDAGVRFPVVLKGEGFAHKTEAGAVVLNLPDEDALVAAMAAMPAELFLVEEMIGGTVAELIVGVVRDPAVGFLLTIGAGGVLTELLADRVSVLLPARPETVRHALRQLKIFPVLEGYRGRAGADMSALLRAITAISDYVLANADRVAEVEVNPLICTADAAIAVDALVRIADD